MNIATLTALGNQETMAIAMIDDGVGVRNARAIASVQGVDAVMIGASDLCADLGFPGQFDAPVVIEACAAVIQACLDARRPCGVAGVRNDGLLKDYVRRGVRMIHAGTDAPILMEALRSRAAALKQLWDEFR